MHPNDFALNPRQGRQWQRALMLLAALEVERLQAGDSGVAKGRLQGFRVSRSRY